MRAPVSKHQLIKKELFVYIFTKGSFEPTSSPKPSPQIRILSQIKSTRQTEKLALAVTGNAIDDGS
jgi:hypothetical protein